MRGGSGGGRCLGRAAKAMKQSRFAPRIYYFHPLLAGRLDAWADHVWRAADLGFNTVLSAPLFAPDQEGDLFLSADHERAHPALPSAPTADELTSIFAQICHKNGLQLYLDVVVGRIAADAMLARTAPHWFHADRSGPRIDPRTALRTSNVAYGRFEEISIAKELTTWWIERLLRLVRSGVTGFGCREPHLVPPQIWRQLIAAVRREVPYCRFLAWTTGLDWADSAQLRGLGFDAALSSAAWWNGHSSWFLDEHELLRGIGSVIGGPEAPFGPRASRRANNPASRRAVLRHLLFRSVATGDGVIVPMGFEFAADRDMERRGGAPDDLYGPQTPCRTTLARDIREANQLVAKLESLAGGALRTLVEPGEPVTALLRADTVEPRIASNFAVVLINSDLQRVHPLPVVLRPLPPAAGRALVCDAVIHGKGQANDPLESGEIRIVSARPTECLRLTAPDVEPVKLASSPRIVINNIAPAVDDGLFAAKRLVGEAVTVEADVFCDGHALLAVDLMWRAADESRWRRAPMQLLGNDRWRATMLPDRVGRYEFTIEAWLDEFGTFCRDFHLKRSAGADITLELVEGRQILEWAAAKAGRSAQKVIASALDWLNDASVDTSANILLSPDLREVMREADERRFRHRWQPALPLEVERPQAGFAAWYELFPRSATDDPHRHGTFADLIRRLPAIRDMGFDVLYLTPIHPIGETNRKGKNNSLHAAPDDVGSPYAIGSAEGGHDAIHPALGTIDDFRHLRAAVADQGLELALDFAIQCSPDHPWLRQHPEWFEWRPDGSVRFAENPPKKYEDIVNIDFYAGQAIPSLWLALRDVVLYWISEGVRIFRVDNPHTKPLPFWQWLIAGVRAQHPDVIFLSEAFTRPKMMYRLAKIGFSQSYTYFTWRNTKQELTDYFIELTTSPVKEYFRPHLFVNTPDINPQFLQTSGRSGFLIRAALAATLSSLWGMYSGFELCESAALPGREEYLNAEKYEIRVRDYNAYGNIVAEITKLNRIRKNHPALQTHLGLQFFPAHNEQVLFYGKQLPGGPDMILVAVSLDPFHVQETTIEVPLWQWNLPETSVVTAQDLMRDVTKEWHGKLQRIRLDPADLPFAIWRIARRPGG
jgi:starch synthase (maltosyl-transferring)